jgi:glycosyltransferase involved in cell wall biosynthesis
MSNKQSGKDILVIMPAYNEEKSVGIVIDDIRNNFDMADILVVDDGSSDNTAGVAHGKGVFLVKHSFNLGIGASFETACRFACAHGYDYIVRMDADGQHCTDFIRDLIDPVRAGAIDIAIGSRFLGKSTFKSSYLRTTGITLISLILKVLTGKRVTDPTSGFCAMNKRAFLFFADNCADDYPEPQILLYHKDFTMREIPISMEKRRSGASSITLQKSVFYMLKVTLALLATDPQRRK